MSKIRFITKKLLLSEVKNSNDHNDFDNSYDYSENFDEERFKSEMRKAKEGEVERISINANGAFLYLIYQILID